MPVREFERPFPSYPAETGELPPVQEAEENLRVIRELMERSTRYSTFSGLSGICAGLFSILGCLVQRFWVLSLPASERLVAFTINWTLVIALTIGADFFLTKRKAPLVGKTILSRLGRQMVVASAPGLLTGALLTLFLLQQGHMDQVYPVWMLSYGSAVCAVGLFSQKEVGRLGRAFLTAGALTLALGLLTALQPYIASLGLFITALTFGGFHIAYGLIVSRREYH